MEIIYKVEEETFTNKKEAEIYEKHRRERLIAKKNQYKHFYLPLAFEYYRRSLEKLKAERKVFRLKSFTRASKLYKAYEEWFERKQNLRKQIAVYRNTKILIKQLSTVENT